MAAIFFIHELIWGEQEGIVKTGDCRSTVTVAEGAPATWFKKFTCDYVRSRAGKIIGGNCIAVDIEGAACKAVYVYKKRSTVACAEPTPYVGFDEQCHSDPQGF